MTARPSGCSRPSFHRVWSVARRAPAGRRRLAGRYLTGSGLRAVVLLLLAGLSTLAGGVAVASSEVSRWGETYFPNVPLVTHEGEEVRFYDDLIKDKVVAINFIFTSCTEVCPAETARMREVQKRLGDRVGRDVFFYSISIDPETDSPDVLKAYAEKFEVGPGWLFLTGKEADITLLRKKLGLFIEEIQDDPDDHNVSLIVGNEATGRWMKRSPFDNPGVLASVIGDWLHNWKVPSEKGLSYAEAPRLESFSRGEYLFRTRCSACHTLGAGHGLGPDLLGVVERRERTWLARWLKAPDEMLAEGDPIARQLFVAYQELPMPNLNLNDQDVAALIEYLETQSRRAEKALSSREDAHRHH